MAPPGNRPRRRHGPPTPPFEAERVPITFEGRHFGDLLERNVVALDAMGWHVIELRPSRADAVVLWRVTIERYDKTMTMAISHAADPDSAVAELVRYAHVDVS